MEEGVNEEVVCINIMKYKENPKKCLNCSKEDFLSKRNHCTKCYSLILKIKKVERGVLPSVLESVKRIYNYPDKNKSRVYFEKAKKEYIRQIRYRLNLLKEANTLDFVTAHDLEYRINSTLRVLDGKSLGKINDPIAHYLNDDITRSYVYQLFTRIQLLKPFRIDYYEVYSACDDK